MIFDTINPEIQRSLDNVSHIAPLILNVASYAFIKYVAIFEINTTIILFNFLIVEKQHAPIRR